MNGKGSHRRGGSDEARRYAQGWERVFGKRKPTKRVHVNKKGVR